MKSILSRALAFVLATTLLATSATVISPLKIGAAETTQGVGDPWLVGQPTDFNIWGNPSNWGFVIETAPYKFTLTSAGMNELYYPRSVLLNLNETPCIDYDVEAKGSFKLELRPAGADSRCTVLTAAGKGRIDLRTYPVVMEKANADGVVKFDLWSLSMVDPVVDNSVQFNKFHFASAPKEELDQIEATKVDALIDALGEITLDKKVTIEAARAAYEALTGAQKLLVTKLNTLTGAEETLADLIYNSDPEANKRAAGKVDKQIKGIGYVLLSKETYIADARASYATLTDAQKALVTQLDALTAAEARLAELKKNPPPAITAKTEEFLETFDDSLFPKAVGTYTASGDSINSVFSRTGEENSAIYNYYFGSGYDKAGFIILKAFTDVDASITYEFPNGAKSIEFVGSYIWGSIFNQAVNGVFEISWATEKDGTYIPFEVSDITYERVAMDEKSPGYEKDKQNLAFYHINNIPAEARFFKLFFKGSEPNAKFPFNYAHWQVPLGYLKVEAYKEAVDMENKTVTDSTLGVKVEGSLPKNSTFEIMNKAGSGIEMAAKQFVENAALNRVLLTAGFDCKYNGKPYTSFDEDLHISIPINVGDGAKYQVLLYNETSFDFQAVEATVRDGCLCFDTKILTDFVVVGNDKASLKKNTETTGQTETTDPTTGTPNVETGVVAPVAAIVLMGIASLTVAASSSLKKKKSK